MFVPLLICLLAPGDPLPPERRDTVVVTGVYEPVPLEETDRSVKSIDAERLNPVSNSVVDLLQLDPSVDVRRRVPGGVQADISIRGGTFGQSLIMLDGVRLNDPQTGHHNFDLPLSPEALSRIEILKGSGSVLYGSDAVGGVVNLVTQPPRTSEIKLRAAAGNFGVNQQRVSLSAAKGRLAQRLVGSRDFSSGFAANRDYRDMALSSASSITTLLGTTSVFLGHVDRPFGADRFYGNFHSWEHTRTWFASVRQPLGTGTETYFGYRRHSDFFVLERGRPELFSNRHISGAVQAGLRRKQDMGRAGRLYYGVEGLHDSIESTNLGRRSRASGAAYAAVDIRALGRFSLSAGLREQVHSGRGSDLSPMLAGGVWLDSHLKLRGSVSRAFRLPTFTELYYHDPANAGSPDLRPERSWSYEAGLDWNSGRRLEGALTVFHRRETNGIDFVRSSPSDIWRALNIQRLRYTGAEATVSTRVRSSYQLELGYSALSVSREALGGLLSRYVFNHPNHVGTVSWMAKLPGKLTGRVRFGATQRVDREPYAILDFYLFRSGRRLRPFLHLTNLTGAMYEEIPEVRMPGRAMVGGIEWLLFGRSN